MVRYLYHAKYPAPTEQVAREVLEKGSKADVPDSTGGPLSPGENDPRKSWTCLHRHAQIYTLAEKYGIPGLKDVACRSFNESICGKYHGTWEDITNCSRVVYATLKDDRQLRDALKTAIANNKALVGQKKMQEIFVQIPQLAVDVLLEYHKKVK